MSKLEKQKEEKFSYLDFIDVKSKNLKINLKNKIMINFPDRKTIEDIPILYPVAMLYGNDFFSCSEKKRYEKNLQLLLNLQFLVKNDSIHEDNHILKVYIH